MPRPMVVTDLDRTMIFSPAALQFPGADIEAPQLVSVEVLDGRPSAFMTVRAAEQLSELSALTQVVPCTTRTLEQFSRVHLPLSDNGQDRYAIASNGGTIVVNGHPDKGWRRNLEKSIADSAAPLHEIKDEIKAHISDDWVIKRRSADHLFCYLVVDLAKVPEGFIEQWRHWCAERGWRISVQGRKIYSIPEQLSKSAAMLEVAGRTGTDHMIAAGDGGLDADMLEAADRGIRPRHGELAQMDWNRPHVDVTQASGVLAGEEMVRWFVDQVDAY
ncbi:HAD family hydrolase [Nakamurella antarctica]|uniref:HAD family hydrolase n=1 Tax=Nakamurella antarctica TaxID=1902245 RepID=A0A3G8ZR08_9ACTN|nr:HAD family hydrolase [Nakamurella antarctica]AZI56994.1 HAD family hydrolase [Nakamurella antarctica]